MLQSKIFRYLTRLFILMSLSGIVSVSAAVSIHTEPIAIDGVIYTDYALLTNLKTYNASNVFSDFQSAVDSPYSVIIVDTGSYLLRDTVKVRRNDILIVGKSRPATKIIQANPNKDLLQVYANGVTVKNLTLDTKTHNAYAAYVIGDGIPTETDDEMLVGNKNTLSNCNILGGSKGFTLYVAGPTYRTSIYAKYETNELSNGNRIIGNYMEWSYVRDSFVFALQKNGLVENNTFSGGELDVYMNRTSTINNNIFLNSNRTGIFISGPSDTLSITNNSIENTHEHGIKSFYQIDNLPIPEGSRYIKNVLIEGNTIINSGENGMDLNYFSGWKIADNKVWNSSVHGIALVHESSGNSIIANTITNFWLGDRFRGSGIFITDRSKSNLITANRILNTSNFFVYAGIFIETIDSIHNSLSNNTVKGKFRTAGFASYAPSEYTNLFYNTITNGFGWGGDIIFY